MAHRTRVIAELGPAGAFVTPRPEPDDQSLEALIPEYVTIRVPSSKTHYVIDLLILQDSLKRVGGPGPARPPGPAGEHVTPTWARAMYDASHGAPALLALLAPHARRVWIGRSRSR